MRYLIKEGLKLQNICPSCGANWVLIEDSLHKGLGDPNREIALTIIHNCITCSTRFEDEFESKGVEL